MKTKLFVTFLLITALQCGVFAKSNYTSNITLKVGEVITIDPANDTGIPYNQVNSMNIKNDGNNGAFTITPTKINKTNSCKYSIEALKRGNYQIVIYIGWGDGGTPETAFTTYYATYNINVVDVISIRMPSSLSFFVGNEYTFSPQIQDTGSASVSDLLWSSSKPSVAKVDNAGKVSCLRPGETEITCTAYNGVSATCRLTVNPICAEDFKLEPSEIQLEPNETFTLTPVFTPENTTDKSVNYKSSNTKIATVDSDSNVTGLSEGTCTITGTTKDGSDISSSVKVTVKKKPVPKYTLTYMVDDVLYRQESLECDAIIDLSYPKKDGYTFSGWSTHSRSGSGSVNEGQINDLDWLLGDGNSTAPERMPDHDLTLYGYFILDKTNNILGDINGDKKVDVSDYIGVANRILGSKPNGFIESAADVDGNGRIDVSDYIGVANIILTGNVYGTASSRTMRANTNLSNLNNVLYVEPFTADAGSQVQLSLKMKNTAAIRGFQFNLYLPNGVTVAKSAKGKVLVQLSANRLPEEDEHTLIAQEQDDGSVLFLCGSQYDECFTGNDGEIATITLSIAENISAGEHAILLKNIKLTETDISKFYETAIVETTMTIKGDVQGTNVLYVEPFTANAGSQVQMSLKMKNSAPIRGFQFNLYLPDGVTVAKSAKGKLLAQLSAGRLPAEDEHTLVAQEQADGSVLFLCGSQYDECFTGIDGEIATVTLSIAENISAGEHTILLKNIKLTETDISKYYETAKVETTMTIKGDVVQEANVLYVEPFAANAGSQVQMSLKMKNTVAIRGFQFNLYLPNGVTVAKSAKGKLLAQLSAGRLPAEDEHTLVAQEQTDGSVLFLCGSQYDECFTGNDGEVATITLNIAGNISSDEYAILLKNIKLTETDITKYYETAMMVTTLTIMGNKPEMKGDTNGDKVIDLADIATIISVMTGSADASSALADVNGDGKVNVADVMAVISIMAGAQEPVNSISVTTGNATNITSNSAVVNGTVKNVDTPINVGILYGTSSTLSIGSDMKSMTTSKGSFTLTLTGLTAGTTYYYCAFAETGGKYYYGETKNFKTIIKAATIDDVQVCKHNYVLCFDDWDGTGTAKPGKGCIGTYNGDTFFSFLIVEVSEAPGTSTLNIGE